MVELNKNEQLRDEIIFGKYPEYMANGYVVPLERSDYRVTLTGVCKESPVENADELKDFLALFEKADDFVVANEVYCWFD